MQLIKEKKVVHCVIADLDFEVLRKKGLDPRAIERLNRQAGADITGQLQVRPMLYTFY